MSRLYLIDGYNVIHHSAILKPLAMLDFEAARDALITKVSRYCSVGGDSASIVFDGRGRRLKARPPDGLSPRLTGSFSPHHLSADSVIERTVYQAADRHAITVVTADRGIRSLCLGMGSPAMMPDIFLDMMRESVDELTRQIESDRTRQSTNVLEDRLDPHTRAWLHRLRGRLDKRP